MVESRESVVRITVLIAAVSFGLSSAMATVPTELKGFTAVDSQVRQRMLRTDADFSLGFYLNNNPNLIALLGGYSGTSFNSRFQNGAPNAANTLLWHLVLAGFSADVGKLCSSASNANALPVSVGFAAVTKKLCLWPAASAKDETVLSEFWTYVMGFQADRHEFEVWRDFVRVQYGSGPAAKSVEAMTLAITNNPYFLLK